MGGHHTGTWVADGQFRSRRRRPCSRVGVGGTIPLCTQSESRPRTVSRLLPSLRDEGQGPSPLPCRTLITSKLTTRSSLVPTLLETRVSPRSLRSAPRKLNRGRVGVCGGHTPPSGTSKRRPLVLATTSRVAVTPSPEGLLGPGGRASSVNF